MPIDSYLKKFIVYCKKEFKEELFAVIVYGSYPWGYFDKNESDYDLFVIFNEKVIDKKEEIKRFFPKISLQYYCTKEELLEKGKLGGWAVYITLLKSGKVVYAKKEYKDFLKVLKKINFLEKLLDAYALERKSNEEIKVLKGRKGFQAVKWALPSIRKRLQLLFYLRKGKLEWDIKKVIKIKDFTNVEKSFILDLDKTVRQRKDNFSKTDQEEVIKLIKKIDQEILKGNIKK